MEATKWTNEQKIAFAEYCMDKPSYVNLQTLLHDFEKASMPNKEDYKQDRLDYEILSYTGNKADIIRSVKRLSDNEVFTIGDIISVPEGSNHEWFGKIYELKILNNELIVGIWENGETNPTGDLHRALSEIGKKRIPLFTTDKENDFVWNDENVLEYAKWYKFSSARITIKLFKELRKKDV